MMSCGHTQTFGMPQRARGSSCAAGVRDVITASSARRRCRNALGVDAGHAFRPLLAVVVGAIEPITEARWRDLGEHRTREVRASIGLRATSTLRHFAVLPLGARGGEHPL